VVSFGVELEVELVMNDKRDTPHGLAQISIAFLLLNTILHDFKHSFVRS
jgi:hypothetical protein